MNINEDFKIFVKSENLYIVFKKKKKTSFVYIAIKFCISFDGA